MAAGDFIALAQVETLLGLAPGNSDEAKLGQLIAAVSAAIVTYCGRSFLEAPVNQICNGAGGGALPLLQAPVVSIVSVAIDGQAVPQGNAFSQPGWYAAPIGPSPDAASMLMLRGYRFTRGLGNVAVQYVAGYAAIPADLAEAACELVLLRFKELPHFDMAAKGLAGETTSFIVRDMKPSTKTVLDRYRRVVMP